MRTFSKLAGYCLALICVIPASSDACEDEITEVLFGETVIEIPSGLKLEVGRSLDEGMILWSDAKSESTFPESTIRIYRNEAEIEEFVVEFGKLGYSVNKEYRSCVILQDKKSKNGSFLIKSKEYIFQFEGVQFSIVKNMSDDVCVEREER